MNNTSVAYLSHILKEPIEIDDEIIEKDIFLSNLEN